MNASKRHESYSFRIFTVFSVDFISEKEPGAQRFGYRMVQKEVFLSSTWEQGKRKG